MDNNTMINRIKNAVAALAGKTVLPPPVAEPPGTRLAELEMELATRDTRIAALLAESEAARREAQGEAAAAGEERMNALLQRLAPLLAQGDAMRHFATGGKPLRAEDAFALLQSIENALAEEGVTRIGTTGEEISFDPRVHESLSGAAAQPGDGVRVRFIGFRQGNRILARARVSRKEVDHGTGN